MTDMLVFLTIVGMECASAGRKMLAERKPEIEDGVQVSFRNLFFLNAAFREVERRCADRVIKKKLSIIQEVSLPQYYILKCTEIV